MMRTPVSRVTQAKFYLVLYPALLVCCTGLIILSVLSVVGIIDIISLFISLAIFLISPLCVWFLLWRIRWHLYVLFKESKPNELRITFDDISLISKLTRLGGTGLPLNMNNKIELFEIDENGNRELLLTTYEVWNEEGYSLKVVKSKSCQLEHSYIETMTRCLLPMVTVLEGSKLEIVEEDS